MGYSGGRFSSGSGGVNYWSLGVGPWANAIGLNNAAGAEAIAAQLATDPRFFLVLLNNGANTFSGAAVQDAGKNYSCGVELEAGQLYSNLFFGDPANGLQNYFRVIQGQNLSFAFDTVAGQSCVRVQTAGGYVEDIADAIEQTEIATLPGMQFREYKPVGIGPACLVYEDGTGLSVNDVSGNQFFKLGTDGRLYVKNLVAPAALATVNKMLEVFDDSGVSVGWIEIKKP